MRVSALCSSSHFVYNELFALCFILQLLAKIHLQLGMKY